MRALVIGGSLGGLLAANLLARSGWEVEVFEQASEELAGRGAGIISRGGRQKASLSDSTRCAAGDTAFSSASPRQPT